MNLQNFELYYFHAPFPDRAKANILFAHANGIPALTYTNLFKKMAEKLNLNIITYDMRGIGKTKEKADMSSKNWTWQTLTDDHIFIFNQLKTKYKGEWILAGHSLGAHISLYSSEKLNIKNLWLFDPPILKPQIVFQWSILCLLKKKYLSPNGKKVRRRTLRYPTYEEGFKRLSKTKFMNNWSKESINNYLIGSFEQKENHIYLRHNPSWEAHLFEEYPFCAAAIFLKLSFHFRKQLRPLFFVGEKSDTCHVGAKLWVKLFFPKLQWNIIQNGSHMFPIEFPDELIRQIITHAI